MYKICKFVESRNACDSDRYMILDNATCLEDAKKIVQEIIKSTECDLKDLRILKELDYWVTIDVAIKG